MYLQVATERNAKIAQGTGEAIPVQTWTGPEGFGRFEAPIFQDYRYMKAVRLLALITGRPYPTENISSNHFCLEAESTPGPECGRKGSVNE
jgi:hypothetical protein